MRTTIVVLIVLLITSPELRSQSLQIVMDSYFEKIGGKEAVSKIKSSKEFSINWISIQSKSDELIDSKGSFIRAITFVKGPHFRKFSSLDLAGNVISEVIYNETGITSISNDNAMKESDEPVKITVSVAQDLLSLLKRGKLKYNGETKLDTVTYYSVVSTVANKAISFYFNKETYLLEARVDNQFPTKIDYFKKYKMTNLILHPYELESFDKGELIYSQTTESIEFNVDISNQFFYRSKEK